MSPATATPVIHPYVRTPLDRAEINRYYAAAQCDLTEHYTRQHPDGSRPSDCLTCTLLEDTEERWADLLGELSRRAAA